MIFMEIFEVFSMVKIPHFLGGVQGRVAHFVTLLGLRRASTRFDRLDAAIAVVIFSNFSKLFSQVKTEHFLD